MRVGSWKRCTKTNTEHKERDSLGSRSCGHHGRPSRELAKKMMVEIYEIWNSNTGVLGDMKELYIGNTHTNSIMNLSDLPGRNSDRFAIAEVAMESCYVFTELLDNEDCRSLLQE